jgi:outer membrane protein, heavy metal efflux system
VGVLCFFSMKESLHRWIAALLLAQVGLSGCWYQIPPATTADTLRNQTGLSVPSDVPTPGQTTLPPGITLERPLSWEDAAAIALWNNPQLQADSTTIGIARGDLIDAGLLRNPRADVLFPVGAKPFELLLNVPIEVLWQRPRRVEASRKAYEQLGQSLVQNALNTVRDARLAHADLALAQARLGVARQSAELRKRIAELTNARLRARDISELEAMAAQTEEGTSREQHVRFEYDAKLAEQRLRMVLGLVLNRTTLRITTAPVDVIPPPPTDVLLGRAMEARPDLRAAEIAIIAAARKGRWERSRLGLVFAQLSSKGVGDHGILTGPGLGMELPIFNQNQGLIARADAEVEVAVRQCWALKQKVAFEVQEARELLVQAQAALARLREDVLPPLQRTRALASDQYAKGEVAYLLMLEQTRGLVDAELHLADAEAAVRRAQAQLEWSVGTR